MGALGRERGGRGEGAARDLVRLAVHAARERDETIPRIHFANAYFLRKRSSSRFDIFQKANPDFEIENWRGWWIPAMVQVEAA